MTLVTFVGFVFFSHKTNRIAGPEAVYWFYPVISSRRRNNSVNRLISHGKRNDEVCSGLEIIYRNVDTNSIYGQLNIIVYFQNVKRRTAMV